MTAPRNVTSITVDLARNALLLHLDGQGPELTALPAGECRGILDVGADGWLLGVEIGETYFSIADPASGTEHLVRSCEARVSAAGEEPVIVIPRRGDRYELSFPSGNQCWLRFPSGSGTHPVRLCATVVSSR